MAEMIRFRGASVEINDDGNREYSDRGPIWINLDAVAGFYDHTILTQGHKIRVMEEIWQIGEKLGTPISRLEFDKDFAERMLRTRD